MQKFIFDILADPITKTALINNEETQELWSPSSKLAYSIRNNVLYLASEDARQLTLEEVEGL